MTRPLTRRLPRGPRSVLGTALSLIQLQVPCWAGADVTCMLRSKAALSVTGMSKVTITGMPMPTVSPSRGATEG